MMGHVHNDEEPNPGYVRNKANMLMAWCRIIMDLVNFIWHSNADIKTKYILQTDKKKKGGAFKPQELAAI